jgi:tRNA threonylcarbamoyladenosine biosynthesis protein TsaB
MGVRERADIGAMRLKQRLQIGSELFDHQGQYIIRFKIMSNTEEKMDWKAWTILAIDTSSPEIQLAVASHTEDAGKILASLTIRDDRPHSQTLFSHISTLLRLSGTTIQDISALAVSTGPGGFTGVRVGLSAVKGLADSLRKPCYGVNSLDLLALASGFQGGQLVMIDAGRDEIYCGFRIVDTGEILESPLQDKVGPPSEALASLATSLKQYLKSPALIIISNMKFKLNEIQVYLGSLQRPVLINPSFRTIDALAQQAASYLKKKQKLSIKPHYIRQSDAEIKWNKG